MSVFKRPGSDVYSYDFRAHGQRHSGSTGETEMEQALLVETVIRRESDTIAGFCRAIISRARRSIPKRTASQRGYVYMLRSGYFIKIGHSRDPTERLRTINTANPDGVDLLFCIPGDMRLERRLHDEFAACHYQREWFFLCGKLRRFVQEFEQAAQHAQREVPQNLQTNAA